MSTLTTVIKTLAVTSIIALVGGGLFIYSGSYPVGADVPHNQLTLKLLETLRERSITRAAQQVSIPADLQTAERLIAGGADYQAMCAQCHLRPGVSSTDFSVGLYPAPPPLTGNDAKHDHAAHENEPQQAIQRQFWIIKHGVKASGMPAWGYTHSDDRIWNMVAFLQHLPNMTEQQYQVITSIKQTDETQQEP